VVGLDDLRGVRERDSARVIRCAASPVIIGVTRDGPGADQQRERLLLLVQELHLTPGHGYRELAERLRAAIASGELPVGSRLPPQRELAGLLSVGRTTVVGAYNLLRAELLVEMTQGAGTWVARRP
jgi:Bacterial regulatory proteins, gntR family